MLRRSLIAALTSAFAAALTLAAHPAAAQDPTTTTTEAGEVVPTRDIVPAPNSGDEPTEAGDRGGALQLGLLVVVLIGIGLVVYLAAAPVAARSRTELAGQDGVAALDAVEEPVVEGVGAGEGRRRGVLVDLVAAPPAVGEEADDRFVEVAGREHERAFLGRLDGPEEGGSGIDPREAVGMEGLVRRDRPRCRGPPEHAARKAWPAR